MTTREIAEAQQRLIDAMTKAEREREAAARTPEPAPAATGDELVEQIRTFLADAPRGKPHEGYRYGELLAQAADRIEADAERIAELKAAGEYLAGADVAAEKWKANTIAAEAARDQAVAHVTALADCIVQIRRELHNWDVVNQAEHDARTFLAQADAKGSKGAG